MPETIGTGLMETIGEIKRLAGEYLGNKGDRYGSDMYRAISLALGDLNGLPPGIKLSFALDLKDAAYNGSVQDVKDVRKSIKGELEKNKLELIKKYQPEPGF